MTIRFERVDRINADLDSILRSGRVGLDVRGVVFEIPLGDLFAGRPPHVVATVGVFEEFADRPDTVGMAGNMGMQPDAHQLAGNFAFPVELVELFLQHIERLAGRHAAAMEEGEIVDLDRIGDRDQRAVVGPH